MTVERGAAEVDINQGDDKGDGKKPKGVSRRGFLGAAGATAATYMADSVLRPSEAEAHPQCKDIPTHFIEMKGNRENDRIVPEEIVADPVYATNRNVTGEPLPGYEAHEAHMESEAQEKLVQLQEVVRKHLVKNGFAPHVADRIHIIVKDGYRPHKATEALADWAQKNGVGAGYAAAGISGHNRGKVADITLGYRGKDGTIKELWMGSNFDEFSRDAHHGRPGRELNREEDDQYAFGGRYAIARGYSTHRLRNILRQSVKDLGGGSYGKEWWHYRFGRGGRCYDSDIE